ncbi:MAG: hypothetical protein KJO15_02360 [Alphaproteobacteria bacterium]|nr:hypothetical protein [Alphaproteobacteria bacterium]
MTLAVAQVVTGADMAFGAALADAFVYDDGATRTLYTLTGTGGGITAFSIAPDGTLTKIDEAALGGAFQPGVAPDLTVAAGGAGPVLYLAGQDITGGGAVALDPGGGLGAPLTPGGDALRPVAPVIVATADGLLLYSAQSGGGIVSHTLRSDGGADARDALADTTDLKLADISALASLQVGDAQYLFAASATEHAITSLAIGANGSLTPVGWVGAADGLGLTGPGALATLTLDGKGFVVAGGALSDSLTVLAVDPDGGLSLADHVIDDLGTRFDGVTALAATEVGGRGFVVAGGVDDGITLFSMLPNGRLVALDTLADSASVTLDTVSTLAIYEADGAVQIVAAGLGDIGLTRFSYDLSTTAPAVMGGEGDDMLSGGALAEILFDGAGADILTGGAGADIFVLAADGAQDSITDFMPGEDRLDLSGWGMLYDLSQLSIAPNATGATITYRDETLAVETAGQTPLGAEDLSNGDILNLSRPPFFPADQVLEGGAGADLLTGGLGKDTISGGAGDDTLRGGANDDTLHGGTQEDLLWGDAGDDTLWGGAGFDELHGGGGNDTLWGGDQADLLYGGDGDDVLEGEAGVDTLYGGDGADFLHAAAGNDRLFGEAGDDTMRGGINEDRLIGGTGDDVMYGDAGFDRLEGGEGNDMLNGGAQADNLLGGIGDDALFGEGGFDRLFGGAGADTLDAGDGPDALFGEQGDDVLRGEEGDDRLNGGPGNDVIDGGDGADTLAGGAGFDTILAGPGDDILTGNFNADTFVISDGFGTDRITDFEATNDFEKIDLAGVASITDWDDLIANHLSQEGVEVWISPDSDDLLIIEGVDAGDLDPLDFLF